MNKEEILAIIKEFSILTEKRISKAITDLERSTKTLQAELLNSLLQDFVNSLTYKNGLIENTPDNLAKISRLDKLFDKFQQNFINPQMSQFANDLLEIAAMNGAYYKKMGFDENIIDDIAISNDVIKTRIGLVGANNTIITGSFIDTLAQTPELRQQVKILILSQISSGQSLSQITKALSNFIKGNQQNIDGAIVRYYRQYAYDTYNQILEVKNQEFAKGLGLNHFIYTGGLIPTSRAFCVKRAGKVFLTQETEQWRNDPDLIDKKTRATYQPLLERGRINCRHMIKYVSEDMAKILDPEKFV